MSAIAHAHVGETLIVPSGASPRFTLRSFMETVHPALFAADVRLGLIDLGPRRLFPIFFGNGEITVTDNGKAYTKIGNHGHFQTVAEWKSMVGRQRASHHYPAAPLDVVRAKALQMSSDDTFTTILVRPDLLIGGVHFGFIEAAVFEDDVDPDPDLQPSLRGKAIHQRDRAVSL